LRKILFKHFPPGSNLGAVALLVLFLGACAGSGGVPPGETVRIVTAEQLTDCRNVGSVHVSVIDKLQQLQKIEGGVANELLRLAKQSAEQLGGNAIVEMTNITDGSQSFEAFRCP
jgi:hypothetical protein